MNKKITFLLGGAIILVLAFAACGGMKIKLDPKSQEFYEYTRLIMTGQEKDIFKHLPDKQSREEFIQDFWDKRDPDPETEENEYEEEFYRRIEYANQRFNEGTPGWKTDRGRIYIYLGAPDKRDEYMMHNDPNVRGNILWWVYYRYGVAVKFVDKTGMNRFIFDPNDTYQGIYGDLWEAIEMAKLGVSFEDEGGQKKITKFDLDYNSAARELLIKIPAKHLTFKSENGKLFAHFDLRFYIYPQKSGEKILHETSLTFEESEETVLDMKEILLQVPYDLPPGRKYYIDVVVSSREGSGKSRRIFEVKT
ncbi:MAG: GWxTD domain-containing protein [Candidatus Aminicenantes bacterium]|nr:GWxTD domain-containing protein [Candidatus Aminicenantes bacterium]